MGTFEARRAANALAAFDIVTGGSHPSVVQQVGKTLLQRPLGEKHFGQIKAYLEYLRAATEIKILEHYRDNKSPLTKNREIHLFEIYMIPNMPAERLFTPRMVKAYVMQEGMLYGSRDLPVTFAYDHVEEKFLRRSMEALTYDGEDFRFSVLTALTLSQPLGDMMAVQGTQFFPVSVPAKKGFYLGHAELCAPEEFHNRESVVIRRTPAGVECSGLDSPPPPAWSPRCRLYLNTYIGEGDFSYEQRKLHQAFKSIFNDDPNIVERDYTRLMNNYSMGWLAPPEQQAVYDQFKAKLVNLLISPLWSSANRFSKDFGRRAYG